VSRCANDRDEDSDSFFDCADSECRGDTHCVFDPGALVITEIMAKPAGTGPSGFDADMGAEWIEIYNPSIDAINLRGFTFSNGEESFFFKDTLRVGSEQFVLIAQEDASGKVELGFDPDRLYVSDIVLSNDGAVLQLLDPSGNVVDTVNYGLEGFDPILAKPDGRSMSLDRDNATGSKNDDPANWCAASLSGDTYTRRDVNNLRHTHYASLNGLDRCVADEVCDNGIDDDEDTFVDCQDSECFGTPGCVEQCTNGADDDGDSFADCADLDCDQQSCGANGLTCSFDDGKCSCPLGNVEASCADSADNDCDGLVDCDDEDCEGSIDCP
jgi:hypothetical protein